MKRFLSDNSKRNWNRRHRNSQEERPSIVHARANDLYHESRLLSRYFQQTPPLTPTSLVLKALSWNRWFVVVKWVTIKTSFSMQVELIAHLAITYFRPIIEANSESNATSTCWITKDPLRSSSSLSALLWKEYKFEICQLLYMKLKTLPWEECLEKSN